MNFRRAKVQNIPYTSITSKTVHDYSGYYFVYLIIKPYKTRQILSLFDIKYRFFITIYIAGRLIFCKFAPSN
jgi:hypothetical protein